MGRNLWTARARAGTKKSGASGCPRAWIGEASISPICRGEGGADRGSGYFGEATGDLLGGVFCVFSPKIGIGGVIGEVLDLL